MSEKFTYLTGSLSAIEHLRIDAESGHMKYYDLPSFPAGIIPTGYYDKCSSVGVAITGSGNVDYLVILPQRPDYAKSGDAKDIDTDPVIFCFKPDSTKAFPTGVALYHQDFAGRTIPVSGYESFTLEETVNDLHSKLIPGYAPLSASPAPYRNAIVHGVKTINEMLGTQISGWNKS